MFTEAPESIITETFAPPTIKWCCGHETTLTCSRWNVVVVVFIWVCVAKTKLSSSSSDISSGWSIVTSCSTWLRCLRFDEDPGFWRRLAWLLRQTLEKWLCFPQAKHVLPSAGHGLDGWCGQVFPQLRHFVVCCFVRLFSLGKTLRCVDCSAETLSQVLILLVALVIWDACCFDSSRIRTCFKMNAKSAFSSRRIFFF